MDFFLRNCIGFFLQLAPGIVLCLLPFPIESFRISYRKLWMYCGSFAILASLAFPVLIDASVLMKVSEVYGDSAGLVNLYMNIMILIFVGFYFRVIQTQLTKKLLVVILVLFYAATQYLLVNLFTPLLPNGISDTYPPMILALYGITTVVILPLAAVLMKKVVREYLAEMEIHNIQREFGAVLIITLLYFILLLVYSTQKRADNDVDWWRVAPAMLFAAIVLFLYYWTLFRESVRRKRDSEIQRTLKIQQLQYDKITTEMEQARRICHDMRHYLNGLNDLLDQNRLEETKRYLQEVINVTASRENEVYCLNVTVNGLLQYYIGMARNENIQCKVEAVCDDVTVSSADLTVLFGNAMENAIHACREYQKKPWIDIQVGMIGGSLVVQISNSCQNIHPSGRYRLDGGFLPAGAFISPRSGGGYGLGSIANTAKKYGGDARFRYDEPTQTFITRIRLNLHPEML